MIGIIEALSCDKNWMERFCRDCPAVFRIPATLETPEEAGCPADLEPFFNYGCVRADEIEKIEAAAREVEAAIKEAVA